jgi:hypothetical protein
MTWRRNEAVVGAAVAAALEPAVAACHAEAAPLAVVSPPVGQERQARAVKRELVAARQERGAQEPVARPALAAAQRERGGQEPPARRGSAAVQPVRRTQRPTTLASTTM